MHQISTGKIICSWLSSLSNIISSCQYHPYLHTKICVYIKLSKSIEKEKKEWVKYKKFHLIKKSLFLSSCKIKPACKIFSNITTNSSFVHRKEKKKIQILQMWTWSSSGLWPQSYSRQDIIKCFTRLPKFLIYSRTITKHFNMRKDQIKRCYEKLVNAPRIKST